MYTSDQRALTGHNELTTDNYAEVRQTPPPIKPDFYKHEAVCMLLMFVPWTDAGEEVGQQAIKDCSEMTAYRNRHYTFDVVNRGMLKGTGMNILLKEPALRDSSTYAAGDGYNDSSLLQAADTGIAMGNAYPKVAAVAD